MIMFLQCFGLLFIAALAGLGASGIALVWWDTFSSKKQARIRRWFAVLWGNFKLWLIDALTIITAFLAGVASILLFIFL